VKFFLSSFALGGEALAPFPLSSYAPGLQYYTIQMTR